MKRRDEFNCKCCGIKHSHIYLTIETEEDRKWAEEEYKDYLIKLAKQYGMDIE